MIPSGLRSTFLAHAFVAGVVGGQHLLAPELWTDLAGITIDATATWRLIGAALIALAWSSWMAARQERWEAILFAFLFGRAWWVAERGH